MTNEVVTGHGIIGFLDHSTIIDDLLVELKDSRFGTAVKRSVNDDVDPDLTALEVLDLID